MTPKTGNLALPVSQQPSPLFSIGQTIVEKNDLLAMATSSHYKLVKDDFLLATCNLLYGVSDSLSVFFDAPEPSKYQYAQTITAEVDYVVLGAEYAFYNKETKNGVLQATVLGTLQIPYTCVPPIRQAGVQGVTSLLGCTVAYMSPEWYMFVDNALSLTKPSKSSGIFAQYIYEAGIGLNCGNPGGWIALALLECNGVWSEQFQSLPANNLIFLGPGIFLSSQRLIIQMGVQWPVVQTGFLKETSFVRRCALALTWKF